MILFTSSYWHWNRLSSLHNNKHNIVHHRSVPHHNVHRQHSHLACPTPSHTPHTLAPHAAPAAEAQPSTSSTPPRRPKRRAPAVPLRRSDLVYTRRIFYTVTGTQLQLHQHIAGIDEEDAALTELQVVMHVEGTGGLDHFVRIRVTGSVHIQCAACLGPCQWRVDTETQVFLNSSARATNLESSDPDEILFPARVNEIDLGPCVCDALALALPATISCGTSRCLGGATAGVGLDGESSGWRTVPAGAKKEGKRKGKRGAKGGPFSVLAGLKGEG